MLNNSPEPPIVLTVAGFDPSCGAGVVADLKTFAVHDCYGLGAITALTIQSTQGVGAVHPVPHATLRAQLDALQEDFEIAAVKIGMLANRSNAATVADFLDQAALTRVVLDPVVKPSSGGPELLDSGGLKFLREELMKRVAVITPNIEETELLTGMEVKDLAGMKAAAQKLVEMGARAAVVKGGHMEKPIDVLFDGNELVTFGGDWVKTGHTHGTGCTFSSAIAAQLASGRALTEAVTLSKAYVAQAILHGYSIGKGPGPVNPFYRFRQDIAGRAGRPEARTEQPAPEPSIR
ncbi:MAG TPA: bifunctional hydroxymethylpyrimidine kinase/phosphomethylpyrimidine kinase [Candidatus Dormibacteraeota bacterium]|nr:bifunctional hydroxymethylpyrimidine kinase/phosphomethylpyrimidine kinase [Candidatus Dormibacteraeota bacterium]